MLSEKIIAGSWLLFSLIFAVIALQLPLLENNSLSTGGWPLIVIGLMAIASAVLLANSRKYDSHQKQKEEKEVAVAVDASEVTPPETEEEVLEIEIDRPHNHWFIMAGFIVYIALLPFAGFIVSSFLFITVLVYLMGLRKKAGILVTSLIAITVFVILFGNVLGVPLPRGAAIVRDLSFMLY